MNYLTKIKNQNELNEKELALGVAGNIKKSWHQTYKDSAWIYVGGLDYGLTEGDLLAVFSQYGEIVNMNLVRDRKTGKSKGFGFVCYEDQRSTILAVDNFNGIKLLGRSLRVDHVEQYKIPKYKEDLDPETKKLWEEGCAPKPIVREKPTEEQLRRQQEAEEAQKKAIVKIKEDDDMRLLRKKIKKDKKKAKKEKKKAKKLEKKMKKLMKKAKEDPDGDWKAQLKLLDVGLKDEDVYGQNEHFNFGKKSQVEEKTHNLRPDFEKADWRDIAIWQIIREQEKEAQAKIGPKPTTFVPENYYVSKRFQE